MNICIISGSVRKDNTTNSLASTVAEVAQDGGISVTRVSLTPFMDMFDGTYIFLESAVGEQRAALDTMRNADALLFLVPTYYRSMPGVLKNFFDIVRSPEVYADKAVAFINSNQKNQDYGARHALQVMQGLAVFFKIRISIVPEILIQDHAKSDAAELRRFLELLDSYRLTPA